MWLHLCCVSIEFNPYSRELHIHKGTCITVIQWNQILLSKLEKTAVLCKLLSSHIMKEEWLLSLSTSSCSLGLPHYTQPLSVFSMCPSLQVHCILGQPGQSILASLYAQLFVSVSWEKAQLSAPWLSKALHLGHTNQLSVSPNYRTQKLRYWIQVRLLCSPLEIVFTI